MLCKSMSKNRKKQSGSIPVYLNVYDFSPVNSYAYWFGLGVYHSGVEVLGVEYAFGAHENSTTGIFEVEPKKCPGFTYKKSVLVGKTNMGQEEIQALMEKLGQEYQGNKYHLIKRNCNHFCNDVCLGLTHKKIPNWVNRLARLGLLCNCMLPSSLNEKKVKQAGGDSNLSEGEKKNKKMRSKSCRPSTLSSSSSSSVVTPDDHLLSRSKSSGNPKSIPSSSVKIQGHRNPPSSSVNHDPKASKASLQNDFL